MYNERLKVSNKNVFYYLGIILGITHLLVGGSSTPNSVPSFLTSALPQFSNTLLALDISANFLVSLSPALALCSCQDVRRVSARLVYRKYWLQYPLRSVLDALHGTLPDEFQGLSSLSMAQPCALCSSARAGVTRRRTSSSFASALSSSFAVLST